MDTWHSYRVRLNLDCDGQPRWWLDMLLIDTLVRDALMSSPTPQIWRIHRRYADDKAGHEFAFQCYATSVVHDGIAAIVREHAALRVLQDAETLREYVETEEGAGVEATSDREWSVPLQAAWPYYIQGVSRMLLELVEHIRESPRPDCTEADFQELESYYSALSGLVLRTWREEGSHAILHHVNALFGYEPVIAQPRWVGGSLVVF